MLLPLLWLAVPAYLAVQVLALAWNSGRSEIAASAPPAVMVPVFAYTAVGLIQQSNLWPLSLLLTSPLALAYVTIAAVLGRIGRQPDAA